MPPSRSFVFTVNRDGWNEIWLMDETGSNRRRLTNEAPLRSDASGSRSPAWSRDGNRIAFVSTGKAREEDQSAEELYVMDADGANARRLTSNNVPDWSPTWSPDGNRIVFARASRWGTAEAEVALYVIDAGGSNERLLHQEKRERGVVFLFSPSFSPDGKKIAFAKVIWAPEVSKSTLMVMDSDGSNVTEIAQDAGEPAWSPDGTKIAFTSAEDRFGETCFHECAPSGEIYVADADGQHPRRLTMSEAIDASPSWSPDGKRIAFVSDRSNRSDHENEIWVMDATGGDPVRITDNSVWDLEPDWRGAG